jgi:hypothetical protein
MNPAQQQARKYTLAIKLLSKISVSNVFTTAANVGRGVSGGETVAKRESRNQRNQTWRQRLVNWLNQQSLLPGKSLCKPVKPL